jgi:translation initiation factor 2 alpha subunit (eIF-2alpha)
MNFEADLKKSLSDAPDVPSELYEKIRKKVYPRSKKIAFYYAVAASLLLAIGTLRIAIHKPDKTINEEVAIELQMLHDYVNGDDLDNDLELYAIIDNY